MNDESLAGWLELPLTELEHLAVLLRTPLTEYPIRAERLAASGLDTMVKHIDVLTRFHDAMALSTFVEAVLTLRARHERARFAELVWSGPEPVQSGARHTAIVWQELVESAQHSIFIAGYSITEGGKFMATLADAASLRGVSVEMVVDCSRQVAQHQEPPELVLRRFMQEFWLNTWPWQGAQPQVYVDPRTLDRVPGWGGRDSSYAVHSMHAKCLVIDDAVALIGSANFTKRAEERNIELGVVLREPKVVRAMMAHWRAAMRFLWLAPGRGGASAGASGPITE